MVKLLPEKIYLEKVIFKSPTLRCSVCSIEKGDIKPKKISYQFQDGQSYRNVCDDCATNLLTTNKALFKISFSDEDEKSKIFLPCITGLFHSNSKEHLANINLRVCRILQIISQYPEGLQSRTIIDLYSRKFGYLSKDQANNYLQKLRDANILIHEKPSQNKRKRYFYRFNPDILSKT